MANGAASRAAKQPTPPPALAAPAPLPPRRPPPPPKVAAGKAAQAELEDKVLALLSSASGSLLDNVALVDALGQSKATWESVTAGLAAAEAAAREADAAAAAYRPVAARGAALYFVLAGLAAVDPMYQFSLDAYRGLFALSLSASPRADALEGRISAVNAHHTYAVYRHASRGLFERHKLALALEMAARVLALAGQVNAEEWDFFLRGGQARVPRGLSGEAGEGALRASWGGRQPNV
jgi:dynein heavy chain, axonemal